MTFACDVAIAGGGPAGAAAAIGLARVGARVLLLERERTPRFKPGEIVEPTIRQTFAGLGVDARFDALGSLAATGNVSWWGSDRPIEADAILNPHGCGYFVDRERLETWLVDEAQRAGARVECGVRDIGVRLASSRVTWTIDGRSHQARAPLVVDATGRGRGVVGPRERQRFDNLVGLLTYVESDPREGGVPSDRRIYIEAAREGWWYSAPLPDRRSVVAFMTDADRVPVGAVRRTAWFRQQLAETRLTRARVPRDASGPLRTCAAMSTRRHVVGGPGWVAIGDAAAAYDPLAGRGVAAAVAKGAALARLVAAHGGTHAGFARAAGDYAEAERAAFDDYLAAHRAIYQRERRWRDDPFWRRRH